MGQLIQSRYKKTLASKIATNRLRNTHNGTLVGSTQSWPSRLVDESYPYGVSNDRPRLHEGLRHLHLVHEGSYAQGCTAILRMHTQLVREGSYAQGCMAILHMHAQLVHDGSDAQGDHT